MKTITCDRCGHDHEIEDDAEVDYCTENGCPDCQDWNKCEECGEWVSHDLTTVTTNRGNREWCNSCRRDGAFECDHCDSWHADARRNTVNNDGDEEAWCDSCTASDSWECRNCGVHQHEENSEHDGTMGHICTSCSEDLPWCDTCETHYTTARPCPCRTTRSETRSEPSSSRPAPIKKWEIRGYGQHGGFRITNKWGTPRFSVPAIGMEMEVGNFDSDSDRRKFGEEVFAPLLTEDFAYPTTDGSLGPRGIEFIGHPMGAMDHMDIIDKYNTFFVGLLGNEATVSGNPSGCHTNFSKDCFANDNALRAAIIACVRFYDALMLFTHVDQRRRRITYCKRADLRSGIDPLVQCKSNGKYSIVNIKDGEGPCGIVEFRLAGMTMNLSRFMAQLQMYHNLVAWANKNAETPEKAGWDTFEDIFLPVMFQESIPDVIKKGSVAMQLPLGDPALSSVAPTVDPNPGFRIPAQTVATREVSGVVAFRIPGFDPGGSWLRLNGFLERTEFGGGINALAGDLVTYGGDWFVVTEDGYMQPNGVAIWRPSRAFDNSSCALQITGCCGRWKVGSTNFYFHMTEIESALSLSESYDRLTASITAPF